MFDEFGYRMLPPGAFAPRPGGGMPLHGGKGTEYPAPDPELVQAQIRSMGIQDTVIQRMMDISEEMLPIQKEQIRAGLAAAQSQANAITSAASMSVAPLMQQAQTADRLATKAIELQDYQQEQMRLNDQRWWDVGVKQEDALIEAVNEQGSQKYRDQQMGLAIGDVRQGFSNARNETLRSAARMGLDPSSGSFGTGMGRLATDQALAEASAKNKMRLALDQTDLANKFQLYGGLKGMSGLGQTSAGLATGAINAGTGAVNAGTNATMAGMRSASGGGSANPAAGLAVANQGLSGMLSGFQAAGNMAGSLGSNATNMWNAQANANINSQSGESFGSILGGLGGLAAGAAKVAPLFMSSDRRLKQNIVAVGVEPNTDLTIYEFAYISNPGKRWRGVMADEVREKYPEAAHQASDGFWSVDYAALGLRMEEA